LQSYKCGYCGLEYPEEKYAQSCHAFCTKHKACSLEITRRALNKKNARNGRGLLLYRKSKAFISFAAHHLGMKSKISTQLSPLEAVIMKRLWPDKKLHVRDIYSSIKKGRKVAVSSVAVMLDRLYERKIVGRKIEVGRGGLKYLYYPLQSREEFEKAVVKTYVNKLVSTFGPTAVSYFNERFGEKK